MMRRTHATLLTLALGMALASAATAQQRPTVAIMPTQYFSATADDAAQVTRALVSQFEKSGYTVVPMERSQSAFQELGFSPTTDIHDPQILRFGRRIGADLVAHPQLMAVGIPLSAGASATPTTGEAVLYLRVLNARTGRGIYTRQIGHEFTAERPIGTAYVIPEPVAMAAAGEVTQRYFERVAGSRQEIGRPARRR
jgi:hypothetical protein